MTIGRSLHIGLNLVDENHYGSNLPLSGCHNDARDMQRIASQAGYLTRILLDGEASAPRVLKEIQDAASHLQPGDFFVLTHAGHGTQVADESGDEVDGRDEAWVLFDRLLLDDEIYAALAAFQTGVSVLVISDSCHSGTITRRAEFEFIAKARELEVVGFRTPSEPDFGNMCIKRHRDIYGKIVRSSAPNPRGLVRADVIQISSCQDNQLAADGLVNGLFTTKLKEVWQSRFDGSHRAFWQRIAQAMPSSQSPSYLTYGATVMAFEQRRPFTITSIDQEKIPPPTIGYHMKEYKLTEDNWSDVRAELERRFPGEELPASTGSENYATASHRSEGQDNQREVVRAATGPAIFRTFIWGFHVEISSESLRYFLSLANPINAIVAGIGPVTGPAAPFVLAAAAFIAGALQLLGGLDRGNGVYVSMSWFVPGVFIPTAVPGGRDSRLRIPKSSMRSLALLDVRITHADHHVAIIFDGVHVRDTPEFQADRFTRRIEDGEHTLTMRLWSDGWGTGASWDVYVNATSVLSQRHPGMGTGAWNGWVQEFEQTVNFTIEEGRLLQSRALSKLPKNRAQNGSHRTRAMADDLALPDPEGGGSVRM